MARVLIGCEMSGRVRDAFIRAGHDAVSCDILPSESWGPHTQKDVLEVLDEGWDAAIFFPPCTYLTSAGLFRNKGNPARQEQTKQAIAFVEALWTAPIKYKALENPVGCLSTRSTLGKPSQIIQPWQFCEDASKATCLWLDGFPKLKPTGFCPPRLVMEGEHAGKMRWSNQTDSGQNRLAPSPDRAKIRGLTYPFIAIAMGRQWGAFLSEQERKTA